MCIELALSVNSLSRQQNNMDSHLLCRLRNVFHSIIQDHGTASNGNDEDVLNYPMGRDGEHDCITEKYRFDWNPICFSNNASRNMLSVNGKCCYMEMKSEIERLFKTRSLFRIETVIDMLQAVCAKGQTNYAEYDQMVRQMYNAAVTACIFFRECNEQEAIIHGFHWQSALTSSAMMDLLYKETVNWLLLLKLNDNRMAHVIRKTEEYILSLVVLHYLLKGATQLSCKLPGNGGSSFYWICTMLYRVTDTLPPYTKF